MGWTGLNEFIKKQCFCWLCNFVEMNSKTRKSGHLPNSSRGLSFQFICHINKHFNNERVWGIHVIEYSDLLYCCEQWFPQLKVFIFNQSLTHKKTLRCPCELLQSCSCDYRQVALISVREILAGYLERNPPKINLENKIC